MSEQPAEHCGHDCCDTPNMPFHDHFLDVDECPDCHSYREKVRELRERATALSGEVAQAQADTPEQIVAAWLDDNSPTSNWTYRMAEARDLLAFLRESGWSLVRLDDCPLALVEKFNEERGIVIEQTVAASPGRYYLVPVGSGEDG